jgi:hypothetical protein
LNFPQRKLPTGSEKGTSRTSLFSSYGAEEYCRWNGKSDDHFRRTGFREDSHEIPNTVIDDSGGTLSMGRRGNRAIIIIVTIIAMDPGLGPTSRPAWTGPMSPDVLPGNGAAQHPFFYTGQWNFPEPEQTIVPNIQLFSLQEADRLANGNTVISNWCPSAVKDPKDWRKTVQVLEVTREKKLVWAMRSWDPPTALGPATVIQLLDEPGIPEKLEQQR